MIFKIFWILRGLIYKPFFGKYILPSYVGKPIFIRNFKRIFIGKRVRIFPGARMEVLDMSSSIVFEENIAIGQNLHIISGGKQELKVGKNTTFSANVFITNTNHRFYEINKYTMEQPLENLKTHIGENCFIGYGAVILAGTILGDQCIVGSNAVVRGTFPPYCVIVGIPAKIVKRYDERSKTWRRTNIKGEFLDAI